jgi:hypothetical protein
MTHETTTKSLSQEGWVGRDETHKNQQDKVKKNNNIIKIIIASNKLTTVDPQVRFQFKIHGSLLFSYSMSITGKIYTHHKLLHFVGLPVLHSNSIQLHPDAFQQSKKETFPIKMSEGYFHMKLPKKDKLNGTL